MISQLLNRKNFNGIIFIPLFAMLIWSPFLWGVHSNPSTTSSTSLVYLWLTGWIANNPLLSTIFALVLTLVSAFILQQFDSRFTLLQKKTFLPAYLFVIIAGGLTDLQMLHPVHMAMPFFLMAIFRLFKASLTRFPLKNFFDAGFVLGLGILIFPQLLFFVPLLLLASIVLVKEPQWRLFVLPLIGITIPPLFLLGILFLSNNASEINNLLNINLITESNPGMLIRSNLLIFLGLIAVLLLLAVLKIGGFSEERRNLQRRYQQFFILMMLNTLPIIVFVGRGSTAALWLAAAPSAMLIAFLLGTIRRKRWVEFILIMLLLGAMLLNDKVVAIFLPQ